MQIQEISYIVFPYINRLASYCVFGNQSNAVNKKETGYSIRLMVSIGMKSEWSYFELDNTGLIIESPRGMAKQFNKKIRITNMDEMVEAYKGKKINQY